MQKLKLKWSDKQQHPTYMVGFLVVRVFLVRSNISEQILWSNHQAICAGYSSFQPTNFSTPNQPTNFSKAILFDHLFCTSVQTIWLFLICQIYCSFFYPIIHSDKAIKADHEPKKIKPVNTNQKWFCPAEAVYGLILKTSWVYHLKSQKSQGHAWSNMKVKVQDKNS